MDDSLQWLLDFDQQEGKPPTYNNKVEEEAGEEMIPTYISNSISFPPDSTRSSSSLADLNPPMVNIFYDSIANFSYPPLLIKNNINAR